MNTDYYRLITWTEDMWLPNQLENIDYVSAQVQLEISAREGFIPVGPPTCGFVKLDEGMRFYFSQAYYREHKKVDKKKKK
jgi:hypothetical protein